MILGLLAAVILLGANASLIKAVTNQPPIIAIGDGSAQSAFNRPGFAYVTINNQTYRLPPPASPIVLPKQRGNSDHVAPSGVSPTAIVSAPVAPYDEQLFSTYGQNYASLSYNVTATAQSGNFGYGPAYFLNGFTNAGGWYQIGVFWNWTILGGGYDSGFHMLYEVWNAPGFTVQPNCGGASCTGLVDFTGGTVNPGDKILLTMQFVSGNVVMTATDQNTGATANDIYSAQGGTLFIGNTSSAFSRFGFFTGPMTEQYYVSPYYGLEQPATYRTFNQPATTYAWQWIDEYVPNNGLLLFSNGNLYSFLTSQLQTKNFQGAQTSENSTTFITGGMPLTIPTPTPTNTLVDKGQSITINSAALINATVPISYQWLESTPGSSTYANAIDCGAGNTASLSLVPCTFSTSVSVIGVYKFALRASDAASTAQNGGIQISAPAAVTLNPTLAANAFSAALASLVQSQNQTLTASVLGGSPTYTYNFLVYNGIGTLVASLLFSGISNTAQSASFNVNPFWGTGVFTANVVITDSATTKSIVTSTSTFTVNPAPLIVFIDNPTTGTVTAYNTNFASGSGINLIGTWPVTANPPLGYVFGSWSTSNALNVVTANALAQSTTLTSTGNGGAALTATYASAPTLFTASSQNTIQQNDVQLFTASASGGKAPYTYTVSVYNGLGLVTSSVLSSNSATTQFPVIINPSWGLGAFTANLVVTDSASGTVTNSLTFSVVQSPVVTFTDSPSNGTVTINSRITSTGLVVPYKITIGNGIKFDMPTGVWNVTANPPGGYSFVLWEALSSNITFTSFNSFATTSQTTTMRVLGNGIATAFYGLATNSGGGGGCCPRPN